jgi:hypothetical protein
LAIFYKTEGRRQWIESDIFTGHWPKWHHFEPRHVVLVQNWPKLAGFYKTEWRRYIILLDIDQNMAKTHRFI